MRLCIVLCMAITLMGGSLGQASAQGLVQYALILGCDMHTEDGPAVTSLQPSGALVAFCDEVAAPPEICDALDMIDAGMACAEAASRLSWAGATQLSAVRVESPHPVTGPLLVVAEDIEGEAVATSARRHPTGLLYRHIAPENASVGLIGCGFSTGEGLLLTLRQEFSGSDDGTRTVPSTDGRTAMSCADAVQEQFDRGRHQQTAIAMTRSSPAPLALLRRLKVAENTSPLPRNRVLFTYNYFNNAPPF